MKQVGFVGPSYTQQSLNVDAQRTLNLYPEMDERGTGKNQEVAALVSTPGLRLVSTVAEVGLPQRAPDGGRARVPGHRREALRGDQPENPAALGTLDTTNGYVGMTDNGLQLAIVDGTRKVYLLTLATNVFSFANLPDSADTADVIDFQDGYFIVNRSGTFQFYISGLYDGTSWDALDVGAKEGKPDKIRALRVNNRELILFGFLSSEFFVNTGNADFPLQRIQGAFLEEGIAGKALHASLDHTVYWVARDKNGDKIIRRFDGYRGERISTFPIERWLNKQTDITQGTMWTYQQSGHSFLALNVAKTCDRTWFYDVAANLWHERDYTPANGQTHTRHRAEGHVMVGSRHIVGDFANGNIYELDENYRYDQVDALNPSPITRLRDTPHVSDDDKWLYYPQVKIDMEMGAGPAILQVDADGVTRERAPMAMLRYSDDGGHKWSNEKMTTIGKLGEYNAQARWRRLGRSRRRMFRVVITDPVKVTLISGLGEVSA
jgi:hypothetical protein